jgi:hypothetical protein
MLACSPNNAAIERSSERVLTIMVLVLALKVLSHVSQANQTNKKNTIPDQGPKSVADLPEIII